jgi:hypothetical protein
MDYVVRYPSHFEAEAQMIESKGWLDGLIIETADAEYRPVLYDEARLAQEARDALASSGLFAERSIVVLPRLTRENIDAAVERLSRGSFAQIVS